MRSIWRVYELTVNTAAVLLFSAMVVVTALGVFFRYVLNAPLPWTEESDRYMFIWLTWIGASVTMRYKAHIAVDVLVRYFEPRVRLWFTMAAELCTLVFLAALFNASLPVIEVTNRTRTAATDIPISWVYMSVPVGCVLIAIETVRLVAGTWQAMRQGETA